MNLIRLLIDQPVTVAVGVILTLLAGVIALDRIPIQLTPNVEDTIISISTFWEGASPEEIEREVVEKQEERLQGVANLRAITSSSQQGMGRIRLEFAVGTPKEVALRQVSDKLREVPDYPNGVDEPVVEASDPDNRDYIAWIIFESTDLTVDIQKLQDFAEDRIKPQLERVPGISAINVLGGQERETQIRFDPVRLAQFGITPSQFVTAIQSTNRNISAGELADTKQDVRVRTIAQFSSVDDVNNTVIAHGDFGPIFVSDVAEVVETYKEAASFVRSKGRTVIAINAEREVGSNVMKVMEGLRAAVDRLNAPGGTLDTQSRRMDLNGKLQLTQVYDQTIYVDDALALVQSNIWIGGAIAILVLLLFLRSVRSVGIIALAIPISVIGAVVSMVAMGRSVNVISLAGMAFAVGMVVDNAIVVLENIFRHLEMGKGPRQAAYDGAREVWGAVLASTLTTIAVFIPILLIQDEAGQLFRDIALAICAAVGLSLIVAISVIPTCAARLLKLSKRRANKRSPLDVKADWDEGPRGFKKLPSRLGRRAWFILRFPTHAVGDFIHVLCARTLVGVASRVLIVGGLTAASVAGTIFLMPPASYLPQGNRNLAFGLLISPPGYSAQMQNELADRVEHSVRPYWEAGELDPTTDVYTRTAAALPQVPTFNWSTGGPGDPVTPPPIENYFLVQFEDILFHGGISMDPTRVVDMIELFNHATRPEVVPDVNAFAFQVPLFQLGGATGSAVKINIAGDDLDLVADAAGVLQGQLIARGYPAYTVQADPGNYNILRPELQVVPSKRALADLQLTPVDLGLAIQANGDGAIIGEYRVQGDSIDLKLIAKDAVNQELLGDFRDIPIATPSGQVVPLSTVAEFRRVTSPPQINHSNRQRSISLLFSPPEGKPLEAAIGEVDEIITEQKSAGTIGRDLSVTFSGSASKLDSVKTALLGDGTLASTLGSSLVLALLVVYLLLCVLFQSFLKPLIIMFSVPLATVGGFLALFAVFIWSSMDRYMPMQMLDVLTMLGFVILIGVVVNNAILIVHQTLNYMREHDGREALGPRDAVAEAVRSRVRPIFMSTLTSVGGMMPLVLMPGSGSELYRGLGSVVLGGLLVSTIFTILLVPLLLSLLLDVEDLFKRVPVDARLARTRAAPAPSPPALGPVHSPES